jgi:hypothetical protein
MFGRYSSIQSKAAASRKEVCPERGQSQKHFLRKNRDERKAKNPCHRGNSVVELKK